MHVRHSDQVKKKRPLRKNPKFWVPVGVVLGLLVVLGVYAAVLIPSVFTAKDSLQAAVPLASQAKAQILSGDSDGATQTVAQLQQRANEAVSASDGAMWRSVEWVPVLGENLKAVRVVSASISTLNSEVLTPATGMSLAALKPSGGAIDVAAIEGMIPVVNGAVDASTRVSEELQSLNADSLVGPVKDGVAQLDDAITELTGMAESAQKVLPLLPGALGADGPKNYLMLFQNNAEIRTTGGNPAALALITVDNGRIELTQQASSADFNNNRETPIIPLDPDTEAIYGDRVGDWMQDVTFTPDFTETSNLIKAFWAESFGTPVDAVVSIDPVALSYILAATGPVTLATGDVLTSENAVPLLLSEVYFRYPGGQEQDAFFAAAAQSIFSSVMNNISDPVALVEALSHGVAEGRIMFSSNDAEQMALIGSSPLAGPLTPDNSDETVLGVFFNDLTVGKMDYYLYADVNASTTQCSVQGDEPTTFTATTHLRNPIDEALRATLPLYVTADAYGYGGAIHTDVLVYGPVGTKVQSVNIDGEIVGIGDRYDGQYREMTHLGRPVLQVPILLRMQTEATVEVTFVASEGQTADSFGPLDLRVTPTVHPTPITVEAPGCAAP